MKNSTQWIGLSLTALIAVSGCKTPQLAWWKSSKTAESTTLAAAPVSPAAAAKQAEQLASSSSQLVGNEAPSFTPGSAPNTTPSSDLNAMSGLAGSTPTPPASYPKTSAPAYTPESVAAAVSSGPIYDKTQPPQSTLVENKPAPSPAPRYGQPGTEAIPGETVPSANSLVGGASTPPEATNVGGRYGATTPPAESANLGNSATSTSNVVATPSQTPDAYGLGAYPGSGFQNNAPADEEPSPEVLAATYRPGGTSSYPAVGSVPMVADKQSNDAMSRYTPTPSPSGDAGEPAPSSGQRYW